MPLNARSPSPWRRWPVALAALALCAGAQAQTLLQMYEQARQYDAAYLSARAQYEANLAKADQGKAALLPTVGASTGVTRNSIDISPIRGTPSTSSTNAERSFTTETAGINASQPLFRPANLATYRQSQKGLEAAEALLQQAQQDLIVRLSQAYFDVLTAQDNLTLVRAQKAAVAEQLASAQRNFEVGTATITDTREAQARFDLVGAQEIAADNDLRVKTLALELLVGQRGLQPKALQSGASLPVAPGPHMDHWLTQAQQASPALRQARTGLDVAKLETDKAKAGHLPTVDFTLGYNSQRNINGNAVTTASTQVNVAAAGITATLPLFAGMAVQNRIRETLALEDKARNDLEAAERQVTQATRSAYMGLQAGLAQVKAFEAAEASSQSALDANKLGYQVGVRINIDVLNSQSQLFQTKRDLAKARYDVLLGQLRLRQAAGVLNAEDLQPINRLLAP